LVDAKGDPSMQMRDGGTALHVASDNGHKAVLDLLLKVR
jgi:ankyrin repeat protein